VTPPAPRVVITLQSAVREARPCHLCGRVVAQEVILCRATDGVGRGRVYIPANPHHAPCGRLCREGLPVGVDRARLVLHDHGCASPACRAPVRSAREGEDLT
jgi:hypothetical protein